MRTLDVYWLVRDARGLSSSETHVLRTMLSFTKNESLVALVTQEQLAASAPCSVRTVRQAILTLSEKGVVKVIHGGQHQPNRYTVRPAAIASLVPVRPAAVASLVPVRPAAVAALNDSRPANGAALNDSRPANGAIQTGKICHPDRQELPPSEDLSEDQNEDQERARTKPLDRESQYRAAYCRGVAKGKGGPHLWLGGGEERGILNSILPTFAVTNGKALRGDALLRWIETKAADFARFVPAHEPHFWSNYGSKGFAKWLNSGGGQPVDAGPAPDRAQPQEPRREPTPEEKAEFEAALADAMKCMAPRILREHG